jgi:hypothetical protein
VFYPKIAVLIKNRFIPQSSQIFIPDPGTPKKSQGSQLQSPCLSKAAQFIILGPKYAINESITVLFI